MRGFVHVGEKQTVGWTALPKERAERHWSPGRPGHEQRGYHRGGLLSSRSFNSVRLLFDSGTSQAIKMFGGNCAKRVGHPVTLHLAKAYVTFYNHHASSVHVSTRSLNSVSGVIKAVQHDYLFVPLAGLNGAITFHLKGSSLCFWRHVTIWFLDKRRLFSNPIPLGLFNSNMFGGFVTRGINGFCVLCSYYAEMSLLWVV